MPKAKPISPTVGIVVPNWNGRKDLASCIDSLLAQSKQATIIIVENGFTDGSLGFLQSHYPQVELVVHKKNKGFAGAVNAGIRLAIKNNNTYVALLNNDAVADKNWLKNLVNDLVINTDTGIATCKLMDSKKTYLDSTGDMYTTWGLPYPRGRGEPVSDTYDDRIQIFAGSGGASLYRVSMLEEIGLFDEDFFAYYEDVDISFRAQLAGWKVRYVPEAVAYHQIGVTSSRIKGFTTYQTIKNLPWVLWKNAPFSVFIRILPRFTVAYYAFIFRAAWRGQSWAALRGYYTMLFLLPKKTLQRIRIQHHRTVTPSYIWESLSHDLPPNARALRLVFHPIKTLKHR